MASNQPWLADAICAFERAAAALGQTRIAALAGVTQGAVSKRLKGRQPIWDTAVNSVAQESGVPRGQLRPDLYPEEYESSPGARPDGASPDGLPCPAGDAAPAREDHRA